MFLRQRPRAACQYEFSLVTANSLPLPAPVELDRPGVTVLPGVERHEITAADGRTYRLFIAAPDTPTAPVGVVYQLDANASFATMVEAARMQARRPSRTGVGPLVLVGIGYPTDAPFDERRRARDLTPWPPSEPVLSAESGGADAFLDTLALDIMPAVERRFAIDPARRGLFGHSFGGLFSLYTLFTRPTLFSAYAAVSPSLWWNPAAMASAERRFIADAPPGRRLMLMVGGAEEPPPQRIDDIETDDSRRLRDKRMVTRAGALAARLSQLGPERLALRHAVATDENHASIVPVAIARWLRFFGEAARETA